MIRRGKGISPRLAVPVASPEAPYCGTVRRIWRTVVRGLSGETMAAIMVIFNIFVLILVLDILLHTMLALRQATCVIGGESLMQCMGK
jgi:uncharacterized membrane protein